MSTQQVMAFNEQGLFNEGAPYEETCMLRAADMALPTDAPKELYRWVSQAAIANNLGKPGSLSKTEIYAEIVKTLWGKVDPVYASIAGKEMFMTGPELIGEWGWTRRDYAEFEEVMYRSHALGCIAAMHIYQDQIEGQDHVEGFVPVEPGHTLQYWINFYQLSQLKSTGHTDGLCTAKGIWRAMYKDREYGNRRHGFFYPASPQTITFESIGISLDR